VPPGTPAAAMAQTGTEKKKYLSMSVCACLRFVQKKKRKKERKK
jgi:hypothetical protein